MAILKPFHGIRPKKEFVKQVASRPYDVLNEQEARAEAKGNPYSFYHIIKPEINFPQGFNVYDTAVYKKGKENFDILSAEGIFLKDEKDCLYIYAQTMPARLLGLSEGGGNGKTQYGIVGCAAVDDYFNDVIKKHELTRPDKEEDRKNHIRYSKLHYEPVFFAYPDVPELDKIVENIIKEKPEYDFTADDGIKHSFWVVSDKALIDKILLLFSKIKYTYVADGHHRTAAAALVGKEMHDANPKHTGKEEYNYFLAVHFPASQLQIMDYNRLVKDLGGLSSADFMKKVSENFVVEEKGSKIYKPDKLHNFGMYLDKKWYSLMAKPGAYNDIDPIGVLDVTILSEKILSPILNIKDLRTDKRIDFVGGLRGLGELEQRVNSGEWKIAFALYPVSMKQLIDIADSGKIMPPKTTWFEPKLRSGLVLHSLE